MQSDGSCDACSGTCGSLCVNVDGNEVCLDCPLGQLLDEATNTCVDTCEMVVTHPVDGVYICKGDIIYVGYIGDPLPVAYGTGSFPY